MKTIIKYLFAAALVIGFAACSEDTGTNSVNPPKEPVRGKSTTVQLMVRDGVPKTYAPDPGDPTYNPDQGESDLADSIYVYFFDSDGQFELGKKVGLRPASGDTRTSDTLMITEGLKFLYAFSNLPADFIQPIGGTDRTTFEKQELTPTYPTAPGATQLPDMALSGKFFMGTLWGDTVRVKGTGTEDVPEPVPTDIGRIVSRIQVPEVPQTGTGNLKGGTFTVPKVRICSVPVKIHAVGQWTGSKKPFEQNGILVKSWAHDKTWDPNIEQNYKDLVFATADSFPTSPNIGSGVANALYTIENTSQPESDGNLRMGSTTYAQLEIIYTPVDAEVCDGTTGLPITGSFAGGTFWAAEIQNKTYIFDSRPLASLGVENVREYTDGKNYYEIIIYDNREEITSPSLYYRVLRNHYYELNVKEIRRLGNPSKNVDPGKVIPTPKDIEVVINVKPWSKIVNDIII